MEDAFPIENRDIPACHVSLPEGNKKKAKKGETPTNFRGDHRLHLCFLVVNLT